MRGNALMLQGTGSGVGKSVLVTALCRIFVQDGYRVAPFKAQNMALNSYVTRTGGEVGRAQVVQAQACRLEPTVDMNPILIKPTTDLGAQIIVRGMPVGNMTIAEYKDYKRQALCVVEESFEKLIAEYDIVVLEGAGSPAEINLRDQDIVNMKMAEVADAPVILVGDIDKGGVFAWLVGTMTLLSEDEKDRVKGFLINKFRGDKTLLKPGLDYLEEKTRKKVLGVVPYIKNIQIPQEDSLIEYQSAPRHAIRDELLHIAVIRFPRLSNFTDFDALQRESDVRLWYAEDGPSLEHADIVILPGTKSTCADLQYLYASGIADHIRKAAEQGKMVVGICGGYQMLGEKILDPEHIESPLSEIRGLALLKVITEFHPRKRTFQIEARHIATRIDVKGYEIHHGQTQLQDGTSPVFQILSRAGELSEVHEGATDPERLVWGTNIHGLFDNDAFRRAVLNQVRVKKGWSPITQDHVAFDMDREFDKLADLVRANLDMDSICKMMRKVLQVRR